MNSYIKLAIALTALAPAYGPAIAAENIRGDWITAEKDSVIRIEPCGAELCGRIIRLINPKPGEADTDTNNPNPKLRNRKLVGINIITGLKDNGSNWTGSIYDPKSGKTYRTKVQITGRKNLSVQGCVGPFCKTYTWVAA